MRAYNDISYHEGPAGMGMDPMDVDEARTLFHRLNNQLGVILAHAELLEAKAQDDSQRARASQVVHAALEAMAIAKVLGSRA